MSNTVSGFFETHVLSGLHSLAAPIVLRKAFLRSVYIDPELGLETWGQTTNLNVPAVNRNNVVDIGGGPLQPQDQSMTTVGFTVDKNKSNSRYIRDFDSARVGPAQSFHSIYLRPMLEELAQAIDADLCSLVTSTNFSTYSSITGGADTFSRANVASAWSNLRGGGVPEDEQFFLTSNLPFSNMIADTSWIQESIVGKEAAVQVQQTARFAPAFGATVDYDPLFPQPTAASTYAALFFHRNAIALKCVKPPTSEGTSIEEVLFTVPGSNLRIRIQFGYDLLQQSHILAMNCIYARGVARPEYGSYLVST